MASGQRLHIQRPPRPVPPRGLIFLASAWLVASWLLSLGIRPPVQTHAASYAPSVRSMLLAIVIGFSVGWPLVRLSGAPRAWPIRQALLDAIVLGCLAQVIVWPLRLVTPWLPERSAAIDLCLGGWAMLTAAFVALGTVPAQRGGAWLRAGSMAACVAAIAAGPMIAFAIDGSLPFAAMPQSSEEWWAWARWSPITAMHALSAPDPTALTTVEWRAARTGWIIAIAAWIAVVAAQPFLRRLTRIDATETTLPAGQPPDESSESADPPPRE